MMPSPFSCMNKIWLCTISQRNKLAHFLRLTSEPNRQEPWKTCQEIGLPPPPPKFYWTTGLWPLLALMHSFLYIKCTVFLYMQNQKDNYMKWLTLHKSAKTYNQRTVKMMLNPPLLKFFIQILKTKMFYHEGTLSTLDLSTKTPSCCIRF